VNEMPTLRETLEGYKRFNDWELEEQKRELPRLTIAESLKQFFELCDLSRALSPHTDQMFLEQNKACWIARHHALEQAARTTN
jgi:hypothetical protein